MAGKRNTLLRNFLRAIAPRRPIPTLRVVENGSGERARSRVTWRSMVEDRPILGRRKHFTPDRRRWRREILDHVLSHPDLFPAVEADEPREAVRDRIDAEVERIHLLARMLSLCHGDPRLGNVEDPLDELVYVMLSRKTREDAYQQAFTALKLRFKTWDEARVASVAEIELLVRPSGLSEKKSRALVAALGMLHKRFGRCTLEPLRRWGDGAAAAFLCGLPEVSLKTAFCVMMYALGRAVFPVDAHVGRVLERIGLYSSLGFSLVGTGHKEKQHLLRHVIPPELRHPLHVNLVAHGREFCRARSPRCDECPVAKLCSYNRKRMAAEAESSSKPTIVDLFCGAGGLSDGFRRAGFRTLLAIDSNPAAIQTYSLNHPEVTSDRVVCGDLQHFRKAEFDLIKRKLAGRKVDVLVGGPPCQGFSRVGWRSRGSDKRKYSAARDSRNHLYRELVELLRVVRPCVVLMENVPGMGEVKFQDGTTFRDVARQALESAGYSTDVWILNAAWYGVPQQRIRQMIVGSRVGPAPKRPPPEFRAVSDGPDHPALAPAMKLSEAIGDLPRLGTDDGHWVTKREGATADDSKYLDRYPVLDAHGFLFSHVSRYQNEADLKRFRAMRPGETYMDLLEKRPELENYRTDVFDDKYFRLRSDQPCRTIVAHLRKDGNSFIHPGQARSLSVREAARVQSFSDSFIFTGSRGDQFEQIGNAVPPLLAEAMGRELLAHLFKQRAQQRGGRRKRRR